MSIICAILISLICSTTNPADIQLVEDYCTQYYPNCQIVYYLYEDYNADVMENRADTGKVYVEIFNSTSNGEGWGENEEGWGVAYNVDVPKGEKVVSYCIYNPSTNYVDDVVAVVDNGKIR